MVNSEHGGGGAGRVAVARGFHLSHLPLLRLRVSLMFTPLRLLASAERAAGLHRVFAVLTGFGLIPMLCGCISTERAGLAVDIPPAYRAARGVLLGPPPALDWWRGFQSRELTDL